MRNFFVYSWNISIRLSNCIVYLFHKEFLCSNILQVILLINEVSWCRWILFFSLVSMLYILLAKKCFVHNWAAVTGSCSVEKFFHKISYFFGSVYAGVCFCYICSPTSYSFIKNETLAHLFSWIFGNFPEHLRAITFLTEQLSCSSAKISERYQPS